MQHLGGFFDLELPRSPRPGPHPQALALTTGRACLLHFIEHCRPSRVWVPFFCCDAVLAPFRLRGVPVELYPVDARLRPLGLPAHLPQDAWIVATQFFGLTEDAVREVVETYPGRVLVDDTHAFFRGTRAGVPSFTVARKYFGVPDGAYLYGVEAGEPLPRYVPPDVEHLVARYTRRADEAYAAYRAAEEALGVQHLGISALSERLLSGVDLDQVRRIRRENLAYVAKQLGPYNQLLPAVDALPEDAFSYPYLPPRPLPFPPLFDQGFFLPRYWLDAAERPGDGFAWERQLSREVIHVPIDHRYGPDQLSRLVEVLLAER